MMFTHVSTFFVGMYLQFSLLMIVLFNMNTPVHTVLIHLPTLCYGSRKQARIAVRLWRVSL